jgi:hypothetical protein
MATHKNTILQCAGIILFCALITLSGCNGGGANNPLSPNDSGRFARSAQAFDTPDTWGAGSGMDSSTTRWGKALWYEDENEGHFLGGAIDGDIATEDEDFSPDGSPLVTAFVRDEGSDESSEIHLMLVWYNGDILIDETFYGATNASAIVCRNPTVEVTYARESLGDPKGYLRVWVAWSQLYGTGANENWDLYSITRMATVDTDGIHFSYSQPSAEKITSTVTGIDEVEPDLAVQVQTGELFLTYRRLMGSYSDAVMVTRKPYSGLWATPSTVSQTYNTAKMAPKIDVGRMLLTSAQGLVTIRAVVVWGEEDATDGWQIFYNHWAVGSSPSPSNTEQVTEPASEGVINILPQVDFTPESTGNYQAVMTWTMAMYEDEVIYDRAVQVTSTPFPQASITSIGRYTQCPDVACYQAELPEVGYLTENWFGLSYYYTDDEDDTWETRIQSFSFIVDWDYEIVNFTSEYMDTIAYSEGHWADDDFFTGTTLCLRDPDPADVDEEPLDDIFGLGWIDTGDHDALWTIGSIV